MKEKTLEFKLHHKGAEQRKWMLKTFLSIKRYVEESLGIQINYSITFIDDIKGTEAIYTNLIINED